LSVGGVLRKDRYGSIERLAQLPHLQLRQKRLIDVGVVVAFPIWTRLDGLKVVGECLVVSALLAEDSGQIGVSTGVCGVQFDGLAVTLNGLFYIPFIVEGIS
jgi:hypothetical protein